MNRNQFKQLHSSAFLENCPEFSFVKLCGHHANTSLDESMKRIETDELEDKINNEAKEIVERASADSGLIRSNATIEAKRITSDAANQGIINISTLETKNTG